MANERRRSTQPVMPARPGHPDTGYDIYPVHDIGPGRVLLGYQAITRFLGGGPVIIDGCAGVDWERLRELMAAAWQARGITSEWLDVSGALKPEPELNALVEPFLGDDPVFGHAFPGDLTEFFDPGALARLRFGGGCDVSVLYGPGAALAGRPGRLVYVDVPKNEIQFRARAGHPTNLGAAKPGSPQAAYKRDYFIDWPVMRRHQQRLLPKLDLFVDGQRPDEPAALAGEDLREALTMLARSPFRARPWFEPGAWGGRWMMDHIPQLPHDVPNYAWSFELIAPENGLVLASDGIVAEVSLDMLLFHDAGALLGESAARFGPEFPIRFDFLDTFGGGNLSVQVHPQPAYIQSNFGERFTQDETYYILDCAPGSRVYLGFHDDIDPGEFRKALELSASEGVPVDVERFIQTHPAHKHDLFLIPHGTVHCSGVGNLVLEISSTPYIFTFKMYDWVRLDLDGKPRPINIERGMANLDFGRRGDRVPRELIAHPSLIGEGPGWNLVHLPTHPDQFYDVRRVELAAGGAVELSTDDSVQVMSLVEGASVLVEAGGVQKQYSYAETFIVPAAAESFRLRATQPAKVVVANVKPGRGPL